MIGKHSLEAWGIRLGHLKGDFGKTADWSMWSQAMQDYNERDVTVNEHIYNMIRKSGRFCQRAHDTEMEFKGYTLDQEKEGFPFDQEKAKALYAELAAERAVLEGVLAGSFEPWTISTDFIPKKNNKVRGYVAGVPFKKTKLVHFNPRSHKHIADRLIKVYGWKPEEFTKDGAPCTDADVLEALTETIPVCKTLARHAEIQKVIGMVSEGKGAYLKLVDTDGRLRGRIGTCTTVTARCNHYEPNLGNVPRRSELGHKIRELFTTVPGYSLVGIDAKGVQLRMMAHYLARYDSGAYAKIVVEGDPHLFHQKIADLATKDIAKTFIYAWLFGAGDEKIGYTIKKGKSAGRALRLKFLARFPALNNLKNAVGAKAKMFQCISGLDGRRLTIRSAHSALCSLLQSAEAIAMKEALVLLNRKIREHGWYQAGTARQVAFVHDEVQLLVKKGYEDEVRTLAIQCIRQAGENLNLRLPLDGDGKIGETWRETH
jgi:DNA polymerase I